MAPPSKLTPGQRASVRLFSATGTSRRSLAAQYGVSETTIDRAIGVRHGVMGPPRGKRGPCAVCGTTEVKVTRFTLVFQNGAARTSRGAGSIELCELCWREKAAIRRRKPRVS